MSEEENIQESPEDRKPESLPAGQADSDKMQLNNPSTGENISPPESGNQQPETEINKSDIITSDIQNMEVHHHPNVEKKNLKEYLLEGLMIFLAVTMGFIAENIREVYSQHETAKTYAEEMVTDLSADTVQLHSYIKYTSAASASIDTFLQLLTTTELENIPSGKLYFYGLTGAAFRSFRPDDAAFQQMKSSGSLRFLNKSVAENIAQYDQLCRTIEAVEENDRGIYVEVRKARAQIFEFRYNSIANDIFRGNLLAGYNKQKVDSFVNSDPPLLTYDKIIFNQYAELVRSRFMNRKVIDADTALVHATKLLSEIKKKYDIE